MLIKVINTVRGSSDQDNSYLDKNLDRDIFLKSWNNPKGEIFGITSDTHFKKRGDAITKSTNEICYEVWQPDLRADKIYNYSLANNIHYKIFPAVLKNRRYGYKTIQEVYPLGLMEELRNLNNNSTDFKTVINLCDSFDGYIKDIIMEKLNIPLVFTFHTEINLPSMNFFKKTKNIPSKINWLIEHFWLKKNINKISCITYQNNKNLEKLKRIYKGRLEKVTMGCDFSFWHKQDKTALRRELNLPSDKFIMITAARLVSLKQIDKFISALSAIDGKFDFLYLIAGFALNEKYANYLKKLAEPLSGQGKVRFLGHLNEKILLKYYNAADLYVTSSFSEGSSISVMEAFACELPVFSTKAGDTAELMESENVGCLVEAKDYREWEEKLASILESKQLPTILNRDIAKEHYDWSNIAQKFINIYQELLR